MIKIQTSHSLLTEWNKQIEKMDLLMHHFKDKNNYFKACHEILVLCVVVFSCSWLNNLCQIIKFYKNSETGETKHLVLIKINLRRFCSTILLLFQKNECYSFSQPNFKSFVFLC